jgi:hypothetical protein
MAGGFAGSGKEVKMLKSMYNPDEREALEYHQGLLKLAEQERFANQCLQVGKPQRSSQPDKPRLWDHLLHFFSLRPHGALALKNHK